MQLKCGAASTPSDRMACTAVNVPSWVLPLAWALVAVPLTYGVYKTIETAIDLFS